MSERWTDGRVHWYTVYSHPNGPTPEPWYVLAGAYVFRAPAHPDGGAHCPEFRIVDDRAYPTTPEADRAAEPWFTIAGSLVYPTAAHPAGASDTPWFQAR